MIDRGGDPHPIGSGDEVAALAGHRGEEAGGRGGAGVESRTGA